MRKRGKMSESLGIFFFWFKVLNRRIKCEAFFGFCCFFWSKFLLHLSSISKFMVNAFLVCFVFLGSDSLGFIFVFDRSEK